MADLRRVDDLLRAINPVPDERTAVRVVRRTDPLWQTIRARLDTVPEVTGDDDDLGDVTTVHRLQGWSRIQLQRSAVAAGIVLLALAVALGARFVGQDRVDPVGEPAPGQTEAEAPAQPSDGLGLAVTFTGDECVYEGPAAFVEGRFPSRLINDGGITVTVNLDELAEGYTYEDFLAAFDSTDELPLTLPPARQNPESHDWLEGSFRTIHNLGSDAGDIALSPGTHVLYCWAHDDGVLQAWPAGTIEVVAGP